MRALLARMRDHLSIRQQTAVFAGLLCVLTALMVALAGASLARRQATADAEERLKTLAETMADRLDQQMAERYREVRAFATLPPLQRIWTEDPGVLRGALTQIQDTSPEYAWIGFATPDGRVRAATKGMLEGASVAQRPWFINGLKGPAFEDVHDAKLLEKLLRTSPDDAPFRFVDIAIPVRGSDGAVIGVLGAHLSWTWADRVRHEVLRMHVGEARPELLVFARDGELLIGPAASPPLTPDQTRAVQAGPASVFVVDGARQEARALAKTSGVGDYPGLGWIVVAQKPLSVVLAPANRLFFLIVALGGVAALVAAVAAWVLAGHTMRPLEELGRNFDLVGRDPNMRTSTWQHGSRDVLNLSSAARSLLRRVDIAEEGERQAQKAAAEETRKAAEIGRRTRQDLDALQQLAATDALTGLLNRRGFFPVAERAMATYRAGDARAPTICMVDIDHFKQINDQHGHATGDKVIRTIGHLIASQVREGDHVVRFGGEEFVVLAHAKDDADAFGLGERIRETIAATPIAVGRTPISATVSIGVAIGAPRDRDVSDIIERADRALYAAKRGGRNRTVAAPAETEEGAFAYG